MSKRKIYIDGMMSGTGLRDAINGGYIYPEDLGLSEQLTERLSNWLADYKSAFISGYTDAEVVEALDAEGLSITDEIKSEMEEISVTYYSDAKLKHL